MRAKELLFEDILELYNAFRRPIQFRSEDLIAAYRSEDDDDISNETSVGDGDDAAEDSDDNGGEDNS